MLVLRCVSCPTVKLIVLQEQMGAILVTIIHNGVFMSTVCGRNLTQHRAWQRPIYIMGLNGIDLTGFLLHLLLSFSSLLFIQRLSYTASKTRQDTYYCYFMCLFSMVKKANGVVQTASSSPIVFIDYVCPSRQARGSLSVCSGSCLYKYKWIMLYIQFRILLLLLKMSLAIRPYQPA